MILDYHKISRIKNALRFHSRGMSISDLAQQLRMNRNSVAKYLEILQISGQVDVKITGTSKIYTISQQVPVSAMLGFSSDMIVMINRDGRIIQVNDLFLKFTGVSREDLIGKKFSDITIDFLKDLPLDEILKGSSEKKIDTTEKKVIFAGDETYLRIKTASTIFDDGKEGITIIIEDITERKHAELALAEREKLYRSVIENIRDVFYRTNKDNMLIMASPSWASMLGYDSPDECIGQDIADKFWFEPSLRKDFLKTIGENGFVRDYEIKLKHKNGTPVYVSTNSHLYYDESGTNLGVEGIFRDITERHAAAEKIQNFISQMEFLSRKLLEFIELSPESDIYIKIASDLKSLIPNAMIAVNSYDSATGILSPRAILGDTDLDKCTLCIGQSPIGFRFTIDPVAINTLRNGHLHHIPWPLFDVLFRNIPEDICEKISSSVNIGEIYGIGFTKSGEVFGNATIFLYKGTEIKDIQLIETYAYQASFALQRRVAEQSLKHTQKIFSEIADLSPFPMSIIDREGHYVYINTSFSHLFGYNLKDFQTGRGWFLLAYPEPGYRKKVIATWKSDLDSLKAGRFQQRTFVVRCKDGTNKEIIFRLVNLSDGNLCIVYEYRPYMHYQNPSPISPG
jgi:PAS domain S-box-containing protein